MSEEPREKPSNFIRDSDPGAQRQRALRRPRDHALPARAQRLSPHRPRQGDLDRFRHGSGVRRPVQPPLRRHQPDEGEPGVRRRRSCDDIRWLGFDWGEHLYSRQRLLRAALPVGRAAHPGRQGVRRRSQRRADPRVSRHPDRAGREPSPYRDRSVEENLDLFARMRAGEFADGAKTLRAKIDMASPNINLRDPVMYRIRKASHQRTGDAWCIYPLYDWAHGQSDSLEGVTHSMCSLEYEDHRPLYDWYLDALGIFHPAADRVRAAEPEPHDHEQAQAAAAGGERPGARLGRSPHADAGRSAPPRLHAGVDPRLRRAGRA